MSRMLIEQGGMWLSLLATMSVPHRISDITFALMTDFNSNFNSIESSSNAFRATHTVLRTTIALESPRTKGFKRQRPFFHPDGNMFLMFFCPKISPARMAIIGWRVLPLADA